MNPPVPRNILITGVSSGIGRDTARELIAHGCRVYGSVRKASDGERVREALGDCFVPLLFDVTDSAAIADAAAELQKRIGNCGLAGLVNNAGVAPVGPLSQMPLEEFQRTFDINVSGVLRVTQAFLPLLGARPDCPHPPGRIVNVSSISGGITIPLLGAYACSKHALESLSDALRRELSIYGIRVAAIEPGSVQTPIWDKVQPGADYSRGDYAAAIERIAVIAERESRTGKPVSVVSAAIRHALLAPRPRTRYPLTPMWRLRHLLPDALLDRVLCAEAGLKRRG